MLFRNKSDDDLELVQGGVRGVVVPQGETHVVTADEAAGFVLQCGPDGRWEPADDEAKAVVEAATAEPEDEELSATQPDGEQDAPTPAAKPRKRTAQKES